jgi:HD-like signal output (HDOD) protein
MKRQFSLVSPAVAPALDEAAGEPLSARVEREIREGHIDLPLLPGLAQRIQSLIDENAPTAAIVEAIEREPFIAAAVVRYANSVAYAGLREVTDLHQAVARLGPKPLQQAVLALSSRSAFESSDPRHHELHRRIWSHSIVTALAARRLGARANLSPETAFLAGLLHDVGKIVVLQTIARMQQQSPDAAAMDEATLREFIDALHCRAGDVLCEAWNIPSDLREVVRRHHDTDLVSKDVLVAVVQVANLMSRRIGVSLNPDRSLTLLDKPGTMLLRLDDVKLANLLVDLEDDWAKIEGMF